MILPTLGNRLREARLAAELSTRALAASLKTAGLQLSHVTLSKYERNESAPTTTTLAVIAAVLGKDPSWFEGESHALAGVRFRSLKSSPARAKQSFVQTSLPWLRAYVHVHALLRRTPPRGLRTAARPNELGKRLAMRLREAYKLGSYPIPSVVRILENSDIRVIEMDAIDGIDAFAAQFGPHRVVVVNRRLSPDRMRLTLAHELGHVLYEDCMHDRPVNEHDIESRAFEFASHLLIPDAELAEAFALKSMVRLVHYKERFGVSLAAMVFRAKQDGLIAPLTAQRLWREFSKLGWRRQEPGRVPSDTPIRMESLLDSALRQKHASLAELARVSGLSEEQIKVRILQAMGATELVKDDTDAPSFPMSAYREDGAAFGVHQ